MQYVRRLVLTGIGLVVLSSSVFGETSAGPTGDCLPAEPGNGGLLDGTVQKVSFQALLTRDGVPLADGRHDVRFRIFRSPTNPCELPSETAPVHCSVISVQVVNGIVTELIAVPNPRGVFTGELLWLAAAVMQPNSGDPIADQICLPMAAVPYAFRVHRVESAELADEVEFGDATHNGRVRFFSGMGSNDVSEIVGVPGRLQIIGSVQFVNDIDVDGDLTLGGNLDIGAGRLRADATTVTTGPNVDVAINKNLSVVGTSMLGAASTGVLTVAGGVTVSGVSRLQDKVIIEDNAEVQGDLIVGAGQTERFRVGPTEISAKTDVKIDRDLIVGADQRVSGSVLVGTSNPMDKPKIEVNPSQGMVEASTIEMRHGTEVVLKLSSHEVSPYPSIASGNKGPKLTFYGRNTRGQTGPGQTLPRVVEIGCWNEERQPGGAGYIYVHNMSVHPDIAEAFEVAPGNVQVPGTIMVIDPNHRGGLMPSQEAYDTKVVGVVSGAGDSRPAFVVGYERGDAATAQVALAGRVNCLVDTSFGAVKPGDMIVTSTTPGHGMAATDRQRSAGAVLGKAMEGLEAGKKGLILVLVTLQ